MNFKDNIASRWRAEWNDRHYLARLGGEFRTVLVRKLRPKNNLGGYLRRRNRNGRCALAKRRCVKVLGGRALNLNR